MVYKGQDLVKHGSNVPEYLHCGERSANGQEKTFNFGVLDWSHLQSWKSRTERIMKTSLSESNHTLERLPTGARPRRKVANVQISESGKTFNALHHSSATKMHSEENIDHGDSHPSCSYEHLLEESGKPRVVDLKGVDESRLSDSFFEEDCTKIDPDCISGQPFVKGRDSSLSRRFSSSLERMTKSFKFKTSSTYKSIMSGPITCGSSPDFYNFKKVNTTNVIRSILMRRLLDPLIKHNGGHLVGKYLQSNRNLICSNTDSSYEKTVVHVKQKSCNVQSLLELTMKNEIPFFKLVVGGSSNVFTAAVKKLPSGKDDSSLTYTFYSVHEIQKKKDSGFMYNIMGHMKISSSYHAEFNGLEKDLFVVRESVLYGPDSTQSDQITSDSVELAAIIVKNTSKDNYGGLGSSKSTVVILPGGSHSIPNSGKPSPLINRWRSGGLCDCGGWDIGCELGVLDNQNEVTKISNPSKSDRLDLCYQGKQGNKHAFSLTPIENGLYSLEYDAPISLLQAFSICVAIVSSQKLTHIFRVNHLQDANEFITPIKTRHQKLNSQTIVHPKIPVSPMGRVL